MKYQTLLLKKVYRNRLNILPLLLIIIFLFVIYFGHRASMNHDLQNSTVSREKELEIVRKDITMFQTQLDHLNEIDPQYEMTKQYLQAATLRESALQQRLEAIEKKDWKQYYESELILTKVKIDTISMDEEFHGSEIMEVLRLDQEYAEYMIKNNLSYDSRFSATQGFSYMIKVINDYLPLLFAIVLIFIASKLYCANFIEDIDMHSLLPISLVKKQGIRLFVGVGIGVGIILFICFVSMLYGWIGNTLGNVSAPVLSYAFEGAQHYVEFSTIFFKLLILISLSILFIVQLTSVISAFMRKHIVCLMIALAIVVGGMWVIENIQPMYSIAHLFPITYLESLKVISGELLFTTQNMHIHFFNGVIVLSISNFVLFAVFYYLMKFRMKGIRTL